MDIEQNSALTIGQISSVYDYMDDIIDSLDDDALAELFGGDIKDVDKMMTTLFEETSRVLTFNEGKIKSGAFGYLDRFTESVEESLRCYSFNYFIQNVIPDFEMNWHHLEWGQLVQMYNKLSIIAARDHGKSQALDTQLLMYDGSIKLAGNIKVGELLMGPDSTPRKVLDVNFGIDENMYKIHQTSGDSYTVNSRHTLTLYHSGKRNRQGIKSDPKIIDIDMPDFLKLGKSVQRAIYRGFKVAVHFPEKELKLDPYFLGLWLGDGAKRGVQISTNDFETQDYLKEFAKSQNSDLTISSKPGTTCKAYDFVRGPLRNIFKELNLINNKHIPEQYIVNSYKNRLELLAGLLDSDGYADIKGQTFFITMKDEPIMVQIKRLADSLGFKTRIKKQVKFCKYLNTDYIAYNVYIGGDVWKIPTKIKRKQIPKPKNRHNHNSPVKLENYDISCLSTIKAENIGKGEYVSITVDGDRRFVLADGTVTHNSYFFSFAYPLWKLYRYQRPSPIKQIKAEYNSKIGMIITNEFGLAKHLLGMVKDEIEANDILKEKLYPGKTGGWAETEINTKNGAQLIVKSFGSKMRGFHPHWIVTDDFMNDSVIYSEDQRNKYISMFHSVIMNMIVPSGQVINVGTPYTTTDLFANLKTSNKWKVFEYPAIFPDGSMLWSNRHSIESVLDKKITQGSIIFSREILCRPISSESTIFPWSILEKSFIGMDAFTIVPNIWSHPRKFKKVVMGCDFAMSSNIGADYSVFMVLGVDDLDNYWVLNYWRGKGASYNEQIAQMKRLHQDYSPEIIMVETNQAQILFAQMARDANLPIVEHTTGTNKYNLREGLPGVAILFEQGRMKLPRGDQKSRDLTDMMCLEFSSVTFTDKGKLESVGGYDDICMATWIAVLAANYVNKSFNFSFI